MKITHQMPDVGASHRRGFRVLVIGAGGNGSAVLFGLPYLHHALLALLAQAMSALTRNCGHRLLGIAWPSRRPERLSRIPIVVASCSLSCSNPIAGASSLPTSARGSMADRLRLLRERFLPPAHAKAPFTRRSEFLKAPTPHAPVLIVPGSVQSFGSAGAFFPVVACSYGNRRPLSLTLLSASQ